jgi:hypothetical protein
LDTAKGLFDCPDDVDRRNVEDLSVNEFREQYHKVKKSVIIEGTFPLMKAVQRTGSQETSGATTI